MDNFTPVVILCGGRGTRLHEETEFRPKPLVPIGGMPILVHIMKHYSYYGYNNFILCLGYKGRLIKEFFLHREMMEKDFTLNLKTGKKEMHASALDDWNIIFAETGLEAQTGSRIKKIEKYVDSDNFLATYGDGVSNVDLSNLVDFHNKQGTIGTLTAVHPRSKYGLIKEGENHLIQDFVQKPVLYDYINGGFFVFKKDFFDYLSNDDSCNFENEPFSKLVSNKQLSIFKHDDFWHCMDTYKDYLNLNKMWDSGKVPWKVW